MDSQLRSLVSQLQAQPHATGIYTWSNGVLFRKGKIVVGPDLQLQNQLISLYHDSSFGGHSGVQVTTKRLQTLFY